MTGRSLHWMWVRLFLIWYKCCPYIHLAGGISAHYHPFPPPPHPYHSVFVARFFPPPIAKFRVTRAAEFSEHIARHCACFVKSNVYLLSLYLGAWISAHYHPISAAPTHTYSSVLVVRFFFAFEGEISGDEDLRVLWKYCKILHQFCVI